MMTSNDKCIACHAANDDDDVSGFILAAGGNLVCVKPIIMLPSCSHGSFYISAEELTLKT